MKILKKGGGWGKEEQDQNQTKKVLPKQHSEKRTPIDDNMNK